MVRFGYVLAALVLLTAAASAPAAHVQADEQALEQEAKADILSPRFDLGIWTVVIFVLLLLVLGKFAWGPMLEGLQRARTGHPRGHRRVAEGAGRGGALAGALPGADEGGGRPGPRHRRDGPPRCPAPGRRDARQGQGRHPGRARPPAPRPEHRQGPGPRRNVAAVGPAGDHDFFQGHPPPAQRRRPPPAGGRGADRIAGGRRRRRVFTSNV